MRSHLPLLFFSPVKNTLYVEVLSHIYTKRRSAPPNLTDCLPAPPSPPLHRQSEKRHLMPPQRRRCTFSTPRPPRHLPSLRMTYFTRLPLPPIGCLPVPSPSHPVSCSPQKKPKWVFFFHQLGHFTSRNLRGQIPSQAFDREERLLYLCAFYVLRGSTLHEYPGRPSSFPPPRISTPPARCPHLPYPTVCEGDFHSATFVPPCHLRTPASF